MIEGPFLSEVVLHKKINSQDRLTQKECRRQGVAKSVWETHYQSRDARDQKSWGWDRLITDLHSLVRTVLGTD